MDIVERAAGLNDNSTSEEILNLAADAMDAAVDEIERLRAIMETVADALYDKGDFECWAALRNALWQEGEKE
jgi:hypothetical protein